MMSFRSLLVAVVTALALALGFGAVGVREATTSGVATMPYILPNSPAIIGLRVGMLGVGVVPPTNNLVLSTFQALTAR